MPDKLGDRIKQDMYHRQLQGMSEDVPASQKRGKLVSISLSENELAEIKKQAAIKHMSISGFIRSAVFDHIHMQKKRM